MNTLRYNMMASAVHEDPADLPGLVCSACGRLSSFGGIESFEQGAYTTHDICWCTSMHQHYALLFDRGPSNDETLAEG